MWIGGKYIKSLPAVQPEIWAFHMTESSTFANLATHFCTEYPHDDIDRDGLMDLFMHAPVKLALTHSSTASDFVAKARAGNDDDTDIATQVEALCNVVSTTPDAYIKLRSMNLTQQLMEAMPPGVRESINRMTSQLLQTIGPTAAAHPVTPDNEAADVIATAPSTPQSSPATDDAAPSSPANDAAPDAPRTPPSPAAAAEDGTPHPTHPSPAATAPAQMLSSIMQSGMFQEMSNMMKTEMDDQHNVTDKVSVIEEKVNLMWDRIDRLEKRGSYKRGLNKASAPRQRSVP
jgi:hypothetical protein